MENQEIVIEKSWKNTSLWEHLSLNFVINSDFLPLHTAVVGGVWLHDAAGGALVAEKTYARQTQRDATLQGNKVN